MCRWFNSAPGHHRSFRSPALLCATAFCRVVVPAGIGEHVPLSASRGLALAAINLLMTLRHSSSWDWRDERSDRRRRPYAITETAMSKTRGTGLLLVRTDINAEVEAESDRWYDKEDIPRLLQVPGFLSAGRCAGRKGGPKIPRHFKNSKISTRCAVPRGSTSSHIGRRPTGGDRNESGRRTFLRNTFRQIFRLYGPDRSNRGDGSFSAMGRLNVSTAIEEEFNAW